MTFGMRKMYRFRIYKKEKKISAISALFLLHSYFINIQHTKLLNITNANGEINGKETENEKKNIFIIFRRQKTKWHGWVLLWSPHIFASRGTQRKNKIKFRTYT